MEEQNPTGLPQKNRAAGTGEASHDPQPSESAPRTEEGEKDHSAGRAPRWEDQWLDFLERVKSQGMLEEEALWDEAKVLLASLEPEPEVYWRPWNKGAERQEVEQTLAVLPLEMRSWLEERGLQTCPQAVALAEAILWRQQESRRRGNQNFLQPPSIVVRCPMEKRNPTGQPQKNRPAGTGEASHDPQSSASPPQTEEGEEDHSAGRAPRWEDQWLQFLERVKSQGMLEEEALWGEAKILLASLQPETEAYWRPWNKGAERQEVEQTLAVLPLEMRSWLGERGLQTCPQAVALAEAVRWRQQESRRRGDQVAAGCSSSAVRKNPPDLRQEKDAELSLLAGVMPNCEKEGGQPGMLLGRDDEETLSSGESSRRQEGSPTEEMMEESSPSLGRAFQEQETQTEESGDIPGTHCSPSTEEEPNEGLMLQENFRQASLSGHEIPGPEEIQFLCSECGKGFAQHDDLTLHQRTHTEKKLHKCSECGKSFAQSRQLTSHQRIHTGEKRYKCPECEKSFRHLKTLKPHQRIHTGEKPYGCTDCGKRFADGSHFGQHLRIHTGVKPYKCSECGKSFTQSGHLTLHQRIHTGKKPYECTDCGRSFAQKITLILHQKIHTGEKPYKCTDCGKSFRCRTVLIKHQRIHMGETL